MSDRTRETPPPEEVRQALWSIPLPVPGPLGYVFVYALLLEDGGVLLIDAGWDSRDQWEALGHGLGQAGRGPEQVVGVVATHSHVDHYGSAAHVREVSGAWVALHRDDVLAGSPDGDAARVDERRWVREWGLSGREGAAVGAALEQMRTVAPLTVPDVILGDGDRIDAPGWDLRVVHTPGHSPGHVCLVEPRLEVAFTGDHILARTTPNISLGPVSGPDPLGDYQSSLERMRSSYGAFEALPGHEERVPVGARAAELIAHHEEQLGLALELVRGREATARDVAAAMPWQRAWSSFGGIDLCMAVAEMHAHLVRLELGGFIERVGSDPLRWRAAT